jgi:hypothetical protein
MNPTFPDRVRTQEDNHIRPIDTQKLDALLRIEELLQKLVARFEHEDTKVDGDITDVVKDISPQSTPFMTMSQFASKEDLEAAKAEQKANNPKRKNPRQL